MNFNPSVFGFDISYYQGAVNFQQMKAYGASFLILRCGYADVKDTRFDEYMAQSNGVLPRKVYHYYDPLISPQRQADKVILTLAPYKTQITRVWLDFEFPWEGGYSAPSYWATYRNIIEAAGYKTGIYTRALWWNGRVSDTQAADFAKRPAWVAQYNTSLTLIPKGWTSAMIWQKGTPAIGIEAGVSSKVYPLRFAGLSMARRDKRQGVCNKHKPRPQNGVKRCGRFARGYQW
jgi:GH25 family lysozyme M1 (1,4-beta-N-acetylmuramidase)